MLIGYGATRIVVGVRSLRELVPPYGLGQGPHPAACALFVLQCADARRAWQPTPSAIQLAIAVLALPLAFVHYALGMPELFPAAAMAVVIGLAVFIAILLAVVLPISLLVLPDSSRLRISRWVAMLWLVFLVVLLAAISARFVFGAFGHP